MILSNVEIHRALDEGRLVIEPQPSPRSPTANATDDCPYQTSSIDLRLANEISYFREGLPLDINLSRGGFARLFGPMSESVKISEGQPFVLRPNHLVLGRTLERVELPIVANGQSLAARVEGKSSYARCGLLVHFTAPTIHSGFAGTITLELINLGPCNISLYPGAPICQLIVETVLGTPFRNDSQFQGQGRPGGNAT
ncbi:MAG: dCTP deaminase [Planctomycetota bacterium]|nr:MAG: dCTP deaminase [Planctomycetota bacterium]